MKHPDFHTHCGICGRPFKGRQLATPFIHPGIIVWTVDGGRLAHIHCQEAYQTRLDRQRKREWARKQAAKRTAQAAA